MKYSVKSADENTHVVIDDATGGAVATGSSLEDCQSIADEMNRRHEDELNGVSGEVHGDSNVEASSEGGVSSDGDVGGSRRKRKSSEEGDASGGAAAS